MRYKSNLPRQAGKSLTFYLVAIVLAFGAGLGLSMLVKHLDTRKPETHATLLEQARPVPVVTLFDHNGEAFSPGKLNGEWSLWFFGFTNCPDVCPTTLATLAQVKKGLREDMPQVVLVSVDPERDDPSRLKSYTQYFDESFIGATGPFGALDELTKGLGVAYQKLPGENDNDYQVDHTSWLMLLNPDGELVAYFSPPHQPGQIANDIKKITRYLDRS